uniref:Inositol-pentakisphosphate 2-kinase n=1 Tax=Coccidioides posadasii RMSCC 3488 TaxID=454284 RepID=A0A0J6F1V1_COCPO|nr:inositol-pentakisphosphate 2-kinase [Coccidioides posadasii RMSCC 3488]
MAPMQVDIAANSFSMPISELPADTEVEYLAEGGANIVYKMTVPESNRTNSEIRGQRAIYHGKLLRLRKRIDSGTPYTETARNFDSQIRSLFRDNELVAQELIKLPKNFVSSCNERLKEDETNGRRPKQRHGVYLSTKEPFGLLITDMSPSLGSGADLWEFKPKWLIQSPSAPLNAKRCRTCALRAMKNHQARQRGEKAREGFCPLDLVSDDFEHVLRAVKSIKGPQHDRIRVTKFLHRNPTLLKLRDCQQRMNAVGLPGLDADYRDRAVSMTLRDCTMFVKVPRDEAETPEVRLGDLDFKSGTGGKLEYWRGIETRLIEDGWYQGTDAAMEDGGGCSLQNNRKDTTRGE